MKGTKRFKAGNGRVGRQLEALRHTVVSVQLARPSRHNDVSETALAKPGPGGSVPLR
jgi:hypothetical protein